MSFLPVALTAVGLGMQYKGTIDAGKAQQAAYNYNAGIARHQAAMVVESGKLEAWRQRKAAKAFTAKQRALYSKGGVLNVGSPLEVEYDDYATNEMQAIILELNANNQAMTFRSEAEYNQFLGQQARTSSRTAAFSTLLTSGGMAAMSYGKATVTPKTTGVTSTFSNRAYGTTWDAAGNPMTGYFSNK